MLVDQPFKQPRLTSSQSHFAQVPRADIPRSVFNRSCQYKTTFDAGYLIPFFTDEVLPGDSFKMRVTTFARLATPLAPFMDNLYADIHFFFVPNRLVWNNWEKFCGAQTDPGDSTNYVIPQVKSTSAGADPWVVGTLFDYFGLPTGVTPTAPTINEVNALYSRAYNLIYNEWYRDQNMINSVVVDKDDGPDDAADYVLLKRNKRHDYFTSSLPWPQKGPAINLPLGTTAPVYGPNVMTIPGTAFARMDATTGIWQDNTNIENPSASNLATSSATAADTYLQIPPATHPVGANQPYADLSTATAATINELRESFAVQRMFERDARGGTRYIEVLLSHFGVVSPDFRLQRPEYLGGGTAMINTSPVPQTSATGATGTPQANLAAMGSFSHNGIGFNHSFVEHGVILGIISVRADLTYQQGLERKWIRQTRFDYAWPALSHLGEQVVYNSEIYYQGKVGTGFDDDVFGYQERFADYRFKPSQITGKFRSTYATPLDFWHLAQEFGSLPTLGQTFIEENPPIDRVIAVSGEPHFLFDAVMDYKCARPMPVYAVPGMIDHF